GRSHLSRSRQVAVSRPSGEVAMSRGVRNLRGRSAGDPLSFRKGQFLRRSLRRSPGLIGAFMLTACVAALASGRFRGRALNVHRLSRGEGFIRWSRPNPEYRIDFWHKLPTPPGVDPAKIGYKLDAYRITDPQTCTKCSRGPRRMPKAGRLSSTSATRETRRSRAQFASAA